MAPKHSPDRSAPEARKPKVVRVEPDMPSERAALGLLRELTRSYTKHHDDLKIEGAVLNSNFPISITANMDDQGKLVGGGGANILGLQTIFRTIGAKMGKRIRITLLPPEKGSQSPLRDFIPDPNYDSAPATKLLSKIIAMVTRYPSTLSYTDIGYETHYEISPESDDLPIFRGDVRRALFNLFTAIGKSKGRTIHVYLNDPNPEEDPTPPVARIEDDDDKIAREAKRRGYIS